MTPINEAICYFSSIDLDNYNVDAIVRYLESLLPKEKEFAGKIWNEASESAYKCKRVHGTSEWDRERHVSDFLELINQLYPEK